MGQWITSFFFSEEVEEKHQILLLGLNGSGKTTILYQIKLGVFDETITPTETYNYGLIKYNGILMSICDISGSEENRNLWSMFCSDKIKSVIYVVDSTDKKSMKISREILHQLMSDSNLKDVSLLIFLNKQDLSNTIDKTELIELLKVNQLKQQSIMIQNSSGKTGDGLTEGIEWIIQQINC